MGIFQWIFLQITQLQGVAANETPTHLFDLFKKLFQEQNKWIVFISESLNHSLNQLIKKQNNTVSEYAYFHTIYNVKKVVFLNSLTKQ